MTIYVAGDIHGEPQAVHNIISQIKNPRAEDKIIVAGDAGLEYGTYIMGSAKKAMRKFPGTWIIMRGNHDTRYFRDHTSATGWPNWGWKRTVCGNNEYLIQEKYPNIWYIKDQGGIYSIDYCNFLFIPGAYSVDKDYRLAKGFPYEPKEQLSEYEFRNLIDEVISLDGKQKIDYIISHTCPLALENYLQDLFLDYINQSKVDKFTETWLNDFRDMLEPEIKHWYFGHYHDDREIKDKYTMLYSKIARID